MSYLRSFISTSSLLLTRSTTLLHSTSGMKAPLCLYQPYLFTQLYQQQKRGMAGHSKWKTIKHAKTANDVARGRIFTKFSREITNAVKEGGGEDSALNIKLASVISRARQVDMPMEKIRAAIKNASAKDAEKAVSMIYEGIAPGGVSVLIETLTDNTKRTFPQLKSIFTKAGCTMGEIGSIAWLFEKKGIVSLKLTEKEHFEKLKELKLLPTDAVFPMWPSQSQSQSQSQPQMDNVALELALLVEADDAQSDAENASIHLFCDPSALSALRVSVEKLNIPSCSLSARFDYIPKSDVVITELDTVKSLESFIESLDDHPDVMNVYDNWNREDSVQSE